MLKLAAKSDLKVYEPNYVAFAGSPPRYINRGFVAGNDKKGAEHPALKDPQEFDESTLDGPALAKLRRSVMRGELWCADAQTAAYFSVSYSPIEFKDGEWVAASVKKTTK